MNHLHDSVKASEFHAGSPPNLFRDKLKAIVGIGVAIDFIGLVFSEAHKILQCFFDHRFFLLTLLLLISGFWPAAVRRRPC